MTDNQCNLQKRTDDTEEVIKTRMEAYKVNTGPIIEFFKNENKMQEFHVKKVLIIQCTLFLRNLYMMM